MKCSKGCEFNAPEIFVRETVPPSQALNFNANGAAPMITTTIPMRGYEVIVRCPKCGGEVPEL